MLGRGSGEEDGAKGAPGGETAAAEGKRMVRLGCAAWAEGKSLRLEASTGPDTRAKTQQSACSAWAEGKRMIRAGCAASAEGKSLRLEASAGADAGKSVPDPASA